MYCSRNHNIGSKRVLTLINFVYLYRYEYSQKSVIDREELEKRGITMKKPGEVTLESEYEKLKDVS